jgi:alpha-1,3-mannosyl-glycoprotein beta-1,2-N-acetylglucosaminyltransferase
MLYTYDMLTLSLLLSLQISRTFHFGTKGGASHNQFGEKLNKIHLNSETVDWSAVDISYLKEGTYDRTYFSLLSMAQVEYDLQTALSVAKARDVRLEYKSFNDFKRLAKQLSIMDDEKAGIPRTAYRGVVEIRPFGDCILFLTPPLEGLKSAFHL